MDISVALDAVGGEFNAFTAKEYTCFHARVLDEDLPLAVDVLGDMITDSLITADDVEAERDVILDEIAMHDDDPDDVVHNLFAEQAWGDGPLGRPIAGTDGVDHGDDPRPGRALLPAALPARPTWWSRSPATSTTPRSCGRYAARSAATTSSSGDEPPVRPAAGDRARRVHAGTVTARRPFEQVNLVLGVERPDPRRRPPVRARRAQHRPRRRHLLRLFQEVRERRGLAYSVFSFASHHADAGLVGVSVGCLPNKLDDVLATVRGRARQGRGRRHHRRGARPRQGPAPRRAGARPRGLRLPDVAARQGRAGLRRAALARRGDRPGRRRHPRRGPRDRRRAVLPARDPGGRRARLTGVSMDREWVTERLEVERQGPLLPGGSVGGSWRTTRPRYTASRSPARTSCRPRVPWPGNGSTWSRTCQGTAAASGAARSWTSRPCPRPCLRILDALDIDQAVLVGNSMGCPIGLEVAHAGARARYTASSWSSPPGGVQNQPLVSRARPAGEGRSSGRARGCSPVALPDYLRFGPVDGLRLFHELTLSPSLDRLLHTHVPTLAVLGGRDPLMPPPSRVREDGQAAARKGARSRVIERAAHAVNFSHPRGAVAVDRAVAGAAR